MYRASHIQSPTSYPHLSSLGGVVSLFLLKRCACSAVPVGHLTIVEVGPSALKALNGQADPAKVEFAADQNAVVADPAWYAASAPLRVQPPSHGEQHFREM